jgi:hypothetical protein
MSNFCKTLCWSLHKSWELFLFANCGGARKSVYKFENTWHELNKYYGQMQELLVGGK